MNMRIVAAFTLLGTLVFGASDPYGEEIGKWRADRESKLKAEGGWLSLAGLFWLKPGDNSVGSTEGSRVQLPEGFPMQAGSMRLEGQRVSFQPVDSRIAELDGKPVSSRVVLKSDESKSPSTLKIGRVTLQIIQRGDQIGVRMRDPESEYRRNFKGLSWFPVRPEWRFRAKFIPQPRKLQFDAQAGGKQDYTSPGYVEWTDKGQTYRLTPVDEDGRLFFVFRDKTAGKSTYAAARFVYADPPKDGYITLDFNKAYNPPCVFTPYSTCPLPPPENRLSIPIEAGELMYRGH